MKRFKSLVVLAVMAAGVMPATFADDMSTPDCVRVIQEPEHVFTAVEEMPVFNGNLIEWLSENVRYPETAVENNIQGRVIVQFVVEKDGHISNVTVARGVDKDLDLEAVRVVKTMPRWKPGKNGGKPVRCQYVLPVVFKLQQ